MSVWDYIHFDEEDGTADRRGIATPKGTRMVMHSSPPGRNDIYVIKIPGHPYYSGRMSGTLYSPAAFIVYEEVFSGDEKRLYEETTGDGHPEYIDGWIPVRKLIDFPMRA